MEYYIKRILFLLISSIISIILIALVVGAVLLLFVDYEPHLYVQGLYVPALVVPALNKTTSFNTSVFVDLKFEREAALTRRAYGDFQMTLSSGQSWRKSFPVGTRMVQGFSMGRRRRAHVKVAVEAAGMPWQEALRAVAGGNAVPMVVELIMNPASYQVSRMAYVAVDASGHMFSKIPIEFGRPMLIIN